MKCKGPEWEYVVILPPYADHKHERNRHKLCATHIRPFGVFKTQYKVLVFGLFLKYLQVLVPRMTQSRAYTAADHSKGKQKEGSSPCTAALFLGGEAAALPSCLWASCSQQGLSSELRGHTCNARALVRAAVPLLSQMPKL